MGKTFSGGGRLCVLGVLNEVVREGCSKRVSGFDEVEGTADEVEVFAPPRSKLGVLIFKVNRSMKEGNFVFGVR